VHLVSAHFAENLLKTCSLSKHLPPSYDHNAIITESQPFSTPFSSTLPSQWKIGVFVLDGESLFESEGRIA
jgi:hypothetical protein